MAKKIGDILGIGLILLSIFIIILANRETSTIIKLMGFGGGIITLIVESYYLWRNWFRR